MVARPFRSIARALDARVPLDLSLTRDAGVAGAREAAARMSHLTGLPALAHRVGSPRKAGILLYHSPRPEVLERHLEYLAARHRFVRFEEIAGAVSTGDWSTLPSRCLALTFDDGRASIADLLSLLDAHRIVPTVFVCSEIIGTRRRFWWEAPGLTPRERDRLMDVPDDERLDRLAEISDWTPETEYDGPPQTLELEQIHALHGRVDFQAHTRTHPILTMCASDRAFSEIAGSRTDLERLGIGPVNDFAYPNGRYGKREIDLVARAGFRSARTTLTGWNDPFTDPFQLRILGMPDNASVDLVAAQSTGFPWLRDLMYMT